MGRAKRNVLRFVGLCCLLMAAVGFFYTLNYLRFIHEIPIDEETPYFNHAYYIMVTICSIFYTTLCVFGIKFLMLDTKLRYWFLILIVVEIVYFLALGITPAVVEMSIAKSIATALGVANGGLMPQAITLFLLWAPVLVFWAHSNKALNSGAPNNGRAG